MRTVAGHSQREVGVSLESLAAIRDGSGAARLDGQRMMASLVPDYLRIGRAGAAVSGVQ